MTNIHELPARIQRDHEDSGYAQYLREVAAAIEAGNVTGLIMAVESNDQWTFTAKGNKYLLVGAIEAHKAQLISGAMDSS
mgnify:CR=1 FL=1